MPFVCSVVHALELAELLEEESYAQWQDVGPNHEDDFDFVFGRATKPQNTFEAEAGLDVSPAVWHYLGMNDNGLTALRFADAAEVPLGPWTEIVTTSGNNRVSSSGTT